MNQYDTMQNSMVIRNSDLDLINCLHQRSTGISYNGYACDLKTQAENIFVRKKFDELVMYYYCSFYFIPNNFLYRNAKCLVHQDQHFLWYLVLMVVK